MASFRHIIVASVLFLAAAADGARILVLFPFPAKSHVGAFQPLMEELANRGHEVTVLTPFPRAKPLANYKEIIYEDTIPARDSAGMNFFEMQRGNALTTMFFMYTMLLNSCENLLKQPIIQEFINNDNLEYDLIIYEPFCADCIYGLLHKFKVPSIQMFPNTIMGIMSNVMGNPSTLSYVPDAMLESDTLDFKTRALTLIGVSAARILMKYVGEPTMDSVMRKYFSDPSIPSLSELASNASFLFLQSHPILNYPRPLTPNTIEVGGLHIKEKQSIPQNLKKYLDEAPDGVIYFSLGSNVRSVDMPETMRAAILKSFSKIKQKVLWKWEADSLPGQPKNVRLGKWLPQHAILAHPNVKLFISHGGLMSLQEATYFGVPLITIPVLGDQKFNALHAQNNGYGIILYVQNITEESLDWAIHEALHEPRYRETVKRMSDILHDQLQSPMERAVFWTEYAIRHKGAPHLRSAALELNFFEYYLLDVIAVLLLAAATSIIVFVLVCKWTFRRIFSRPKTNVSKGKKER